MVQGTRCGRSKENHVNICKGYACKRKQKYCYTSMHTYIHMFECIPIYIYIYIYIDTCIGKGMCI